MNRTEIRASCSTWIAVIVAAFALLGSASADEKPSNNNSAVVDDSTEAPSKLPAEFSAVYSVLIGVDGLIKDARGVVGTGNRIRGIL
jgi:hypothetical protein